MRKNFYFLYFKVYFCFTTPLVLQLTYDDKYGINILYYIIYINMYDINTSLLTTLLRFYFM